MRIYRLDWHDPDDGSCVAWACSKEEAAGRRREILFGFTEESSAPEVQIKPVDFPTKKKDVVGWLDVYFTRDNG